MRTVQMLAPMRISKLPKMENSVDTKNVKPLFFRIPLFSETSVYEREQRVLWEELTRLVPRRHK
jgi:hypothetical protein